MSEKPTKDSCGCCGGIIVEKIVKEFDPRTGPLIFGPGSRDQHREVSKGFHCKICGVKYEFIPKS